MVDPVPMPEPHLQQPERPKGESLWWRLLWLVIIAALISLGQTLLFALAVVQLILMAANSRRRNAEIASFGARLGGWLAKAAKFQTAASEEKPWPWSPFD